MNVILNLKKFISKNPKFAYYLRYKKYIYQMSKINVLDIEKKKKYLDKIYYPIFNRHINWNNPQTYTEKMQYYKLFNDDWSQMAKLTDKYLVRNWVESKIGKDYLIPLIGVYDNFDEIDFEHLPHSFVIKCNHDSGSVTVIKDKNNCDWNKLKYKYDFLIKTDFSKFTLEKHYSLIKPKIIIEELIQDESGDLPDYKFLCFNSTPHYCWVDTGRFNDHKRNTYDLDWNKQTWTQQNYANDITVTKPINFETMRELAQVLCSGFDEVRVDFYNVNGKIYFGEMTFTNGSGFEYLDFDTDLMLGKLWNF